MKWNAVELERPLLCCLFFFFSCVRLLFFVLNLGNIRRQLNVDNFNVHIMCAQRFFVCVCADYFTLSWHRRLIYVPCFTVSWIQVKRWLSPVELQTKPKSIYDEWTVHNVCKIHKKYHFRYSLLELHGFVCRVAKMAGHKQHSIYSLVLLSQNCLAICFTCMLFHK